MRGSEAFDTSDTSEDQEIIDSEEEEERQAEMAEFMASWVEHQPEQSASMDYFIAVTRTIYGITEDDVHRLVQYMVQEEMARTRYISYSQTFEITTDLALTDEEDSGWEEEDD